VHKGGSDASAEAAAPQTLLHKGGSDASAEAAAPLTSPAAKVQFCPIHRLGSNISKALQPLGQLPTNCSLSVVVSCFANLTLVLALLRLLLQEYIMNKLQKQLEKLAGEKATLQRERTDLQRQTSELSAAVDKLNRDKVGSGVSSWSGCLLSVITVPHGCCCHDCYMITYTCRLACLQKTTLFAAFSSCAGPCTQYAIFVVAFQPNHVLPLLAAAHHACQSHAVDPSQATQSHTCCPLTCSATTHHCH
jgi:hypothetical protein